MNEKNKIFSFFFAVLILFNSWTVYFTVPVPTLFHAIYLLLLFLFFKDLTVKKTRLFIVFFFISMWYFLPSDLEFKGICTGFYRSLVISSLFLLKDECIYYVYNYFVSILSLVLLFGIVAHILRFLDIFSFPQIDIVFRDERYYEVYFLHVYQSNTSMRFASIFDEPGYLGTLCGFLLALGRFDFKKYQNLIFLFAGMLSLSFAFYVILFVLLALYLIKERKISIMFAVFSVGLLLVYCFPDFFSVIIERPELVSMSQGTGFQDSRGGTAGMRDNLDTIHSRSFINILIGNGYDAPLKLFKYNTVGIASSSIFRLIFQMGYLGLLSLLFFIVFNTKKQFHSLLFSLVFILSLYQRPHIFEMTFIFLLAYAFLLSEGYEPINIIRHRKSDNRV